ncbi:Lsr2 family protein [Janibacter sp. HTCC2649]|uniref:histone-like nucleoid-structuring protein Lsr2 n=1 Tax=Janibacter sp. HTCC2649 TaxID=313589 RepID=UPI000322FAE6|nr:Lsr2 family protein [Janibacter sp. HTCC2649]
MAQRVQVLLVDDLDNSDADETVTFALDGVTYEIDLNEGNASKLRDAFAPWVGHARRSGGRKATGRSAGARRKDVSAVREWARKNGHDVSERGRIPATIQEAYDKANN